ncbi:MAG TPA: hypothetical protein VLI93_09650 [Acetobacteraceae bacterium]|nr:hypothetical protein [Acetobacteraceae bacterium]
MSDFLSETEATIARWHGVVAPNEPARHMTADLAAIIRDFEALRDTPRFEDEPSSFEAALHATMEQP